jgi:hypothetical protein
MSDSVKAFFWVGIFGGSCGVRVSTGGASTTLTSSAWEHPPIEAKTQIDTATTPVTSRSRKTFVINFSPKRERMIPQLNGLWSMISGKSTPHIEMRSANGLCRFFM